jgi:hypothetical protein
LASKESEENDTVECKDENRAVEGELPDDSSDNSLEKEEKKEKQTNVESNKEEVDSTTFTRSGFLDVFFDRFVLPTIWEKIMSSMSGKSLLDSNIFSLLSAPCGNVEIFRKPEESADMEA